jgi:Flp pilus assembly protein CpaB
VQLLVGLLVLAGAVLSLVVLYRGAQPQTVAVLRAARDVQPGEVLQSGDLQVAAEALPEDVAATLVAAAERDALVGRRLTQPLNGGDLVTWRQVAPAALTLGPDERLYALSVPAETAQGLHLQAGDQVEIVVTTNRTRPEQAETRVVLPAVAVFAIASSQASPGLGVSASPDRAGLGSGKLATLVLRTDDAGYQALARARQVGDLDLSLVGGTRSAQ